MASKINKGEILAKFFDDGEYTALFADGAVSAACGYAAGQQAYAVYQNGEAVTVKDVEKNIKVLEMAAQTGCPVVTFYNSVGAKLAEGLDVLTASAKLNATIAKVSGVVPQVAVVLGVCGGYQMLGEQLCDPAGEESGTPCTLRGLGLLPTTTAFGTEKHLTQTAACVTTEPFAGAKLTGYEIHAGRTEVRGSAFCILADGTPEGCVQDGVFGTYLHGLFDTGELTEKLTAFLCKRKGIDPAGAELIPMEQYRQQQFDLLADGVRAALDMPAIHAAMGMQKGDNT